MPNDSIHAEHRPSAQADPILTGRIVDGPAYSRLTIDGRACINFCGCGYLALSAVPEIRAAVRQALDDGVPFARQLPSAKGAVEQVFESVERAAADAYGTETSVYFATGYLIGVVGLASIDQPYDLIFLDEHAHYNLKDAARLSGLPTVSFAHCDAESLRQLLSKHVNPRQRPLVLTDGVFPTSGRVAPLSDYAAELVSYEGRLFIDEAHSFGVIGNTGRGAAEYCGVERLSTIGATFSKAYCAQGAFVPCSNAVARRLRELPAVRGACAGSPLSAVACTASLTYVAARPELRTKLRATTDYLRARLRAIGVDVTDSPAPIVSFQSGNQADMRALQHRAFANGILVNYSTYIGAGTEGRIVCAVFADHSRSDIDALVDVIRVQR
jgi:8-amino-7-oxononanoate synthase